MSLRIKPSLWSLIIAVVAAGLLLVSPAAVKGIKKTMSALAETYQTAIDEAQQGEDDAAVTEDDEGAPVRQGLVRINDAISPYAGVKVLTLKTVQFFPESRALAKVMDLRPLLALRNRYNQVLAAYHLAKVEVAAATQELARLTKLAKSTGSVARKNVTEARIALQKAKAALRGHEIALQSVKDEAIQTWGPVITRWLLEDKDKEWQRLLSHQDSLLFVTLPVGVLLSPEVSFIKVSTDGLRRSARKAYLVSPAVTTDKLLQGETYFFKTVTGKLRTGMRLDAWVPQSNTVLKGIFIPDHAIVWNEGQAWIYIQVGENQYQRLKLASPLPAAGGVFVQQGVQAGDKLVIQGAQMLLSQEFKWQISDEDED